MHCLCTDRSKSLPGEVLGAVKVRELRVIERMNSLTDSYPYKKRIAILKCREEKYIYHLKTLNLYWCYVIGTFPKTENGALDSLVLVNKTYDVSHFFLAMPVGRCTSLWEPVDFFAAKSGGKKLLWIHQEITLPGVNTRAGECQLAVLVTLAPLVLAKHVGTVRRCGADAGNSHRTPENQM